MSSMTMALYLWFFELVLDTSRVHTDGFSASKVQLSPCLIYPMQQTVQTVFHLSKNLNNKYGLFTDAQNIPLCLTQRILLKIYNKYIARDEIKMHQ